jgi:hypothetical protein
MMPTPPAIQRLAPHRRNFSPPQILDDVSLIEAHCAADFDKWLMTRGLQISYSRSR